MTKYEPSNFLKRILESYENDLEVPVFAPQKAIGLHYTRRASAKQIWERRLELNEWVGTLGSEEQSYLSNFFAASWDFLEPRSWYTLPGRLTNINRSAQYDRKAFQIMVGIKYLSWRSEGEDIQEYQKVVREMVATLNKISPNNRLEQEVLGNMNLNESLENKV